MAPVEDDKEPDICQDLPRVDSTNRQQVSGTLKCNYECPHVIQHLKTHNQRAMDNMDRLNPVMGKF